MTLPATTMTLNHGHGDGVEAGSSLTTRDEDAAWLRFVQNAARSDPVAASDS